MNGHVCFVAFYTIQQTPALSCRGTCWVRACGPADGSADGEQCYLDSSPGWLSRANSACWPGAEGSDCLLAAKLSTAAAA